MTLNLLTLDCSLIAQQKKSGVYPQISHVPQKLHDRLKWDIDKDLGLRHSISSNPRWAMGSLYFGENWYHMYYIIGMHCIDIVWQSVMLHVTCHPSIPVTTVFYLKFFEHLSFGQVAHEIYPSEWKVHSSEISITIMYCWYMFLMAVATDLTHVTILI